MSSGAARVNPSEPEAKGPNAIPPAACVRCGQALASQVAGGTCPRCLLQCALDETDVESLDDPPAGIDSTAPAAPTPRPAARRGLPLSFGRYEIKRHVGRGAMGDVYLAHDRQLNRRVALKTPQLGQSADPTLLERFRREAQVAAGLSHPNLCPVYDIGEVDGVMYYTMPFIDGQPLTRWIDEGRPLSVRQIAGLVRKLALTMAKAHELGIVHRDLKPGNVMIDQRGEPIIMDFGLARRLALDSRLTQSNVVVGTPAYLAPELVSGGAESASSDVYALGVLLFELLTRRLPFQGPLGEMMAQIARDAAPRPSQFRAELPAAMDAICGRALAKRPDERFGAMVEMAEWLDRFLRAPLAEAAGAPAVAPWPTETRTTVTRTTVRQWQLVGLCGGAGLVLALVVAGVWSRASSGKQERPSEADPRASLAAGTGGAAPSTSPIAAEKQGPERLANGSDAGPSGSSAPSIAPNSERGSGLDPAARAADVAEGGEASLTSGSRRERGTGSMVGAGQASPSERVGGGAVRATATRPGASFPSRIVADAADSIARPARPPRSADLMTQRVLTQLRAAGDERQRLRNELKQISTRLQDEIPKAVAKLNGDLAGVRRVGEEATLDLQDIERRIAAVNVRRSKESGFDQRQSTREITALGQTRAEAVARIQRLEVEARGKLTELANFERETLELRRSNEKLVRETGSLIDQVFWIADPAGTLGGAAYVEIAQIYSAWLSESGEQAEILALRAVARANAGQFDPAQRDAQRAVQLAPKSALALAAASYVKFCRGPTADVIADLARTIRLAPQAPYAYFFRGLVQRSKSAHAAALDDFQKTRGFAPDSAWAAAQWVWQWTLLTSERMDDANLAEGDEVLEAGRRAVELTGELSWFCQSALAAAGAELGRFDDAVEWATCAWELAPREHREAVGKRLEVYRTRRSAP